MSMVQIDLASPDPTHAINAFLWALNNARKLGFTPKTEHLLAEHLFREDARVLYYSSVSGVISIVEGKDNDDIDFEDTMEVIQLITKRRRRNRDARKAVESIAAFASGIAARSDETLQAAQPEARARPDAQTQSESPNE